MRTKENPFPWKKNDSEKIMPGMTLRDWFAGQVVASVARFNTMGNASIGYDEIAGRAYGIADAMLAARAKPEAKP